MKLSNKIDVLELNQSNLMDSLCQGFEGGHFYGLEYILDDFLDNTKEISPTPPGFDWYGLDG
jgi:hypothetical protein